MRYSRLLAPCLLCVAFMLTKTAHTAVSETTAGNRRALANLPQIQISKEEQLLYNNFNNINNNHHQLTISSSISSSIRSSSSSIRNSRSSSSSSSQSQNRTECLALNEYRATRICRKQMDWRGVCLENCGRRLDSTLPSPPLQEGKCLEELRRLINLDQQTAVMAKNHEELLLRFDCPQPYSVKFQCSQCQEAYHSWICSANIQYWKGERIIKPCRSFCHSVVQKCPFFLPLDKGPAHYAGEPTFLCLDPNIEETGEQLEKSSYGTDNCCYDNCDQGECRIKGPCNEDNRKSTSISTIKTASTISSSKSSSIHLSRLLLLLTTMLFTFSLTTHSLYRTKLII